MLLDFPAQETLRLQCALLAQVLRDIGVLDPRSGRGSLRSVRVQVNQPPDDESHQLQRLRESEGVLCDLLALSGHTFPEQDYGPAQDFEHAGGVCDVSSVALPLQVPASDLLGNFHKSE